MMLIRPNWPVQCTSTTIPEVHCYKRHLRAVDREVTQDRASGTTLHAVVMEDGDVLGHPGHTREGELWTGLNLHWHPLAASKNA